MSISAVSLTLEHHNRLLRLLLEEANLDDPDVRGLLVEDLPPAVKADLARSPVKAVDLERILRLAERCTELVNGQPAILALIDRAKVFTQNGTAQLDHLLDELRSSDGVHRVPAMTSEQLTRLLRILASISDFDTAEGRELLLISLPPSLITQIRRNSNKHVDLLAIVNLVQRSILKDGSPALYQLIDNVLIFYDTSDAGQNLRALYDEIKASAPPAVSLPVPVQPGAGVQAVVTAAVPQPLLELTGEQLEQLHSAMLSAFPTKVSLARMLAFEMDEQLASISGSDNLGDMIFEVLEWARSRGRLREIITASLSAIPGNPGLVTFARQVGEAGVQKTSDGASSAPLEIAGVQLKQLQNALVSAFPNRDDLRQMVLFGLGENLDTISSNSNLRNVVLALLKWSESRGRVGNLLAAALNANPGNPELAALATQIGVAVAAVSAVAPDLVAPATPLSTPSIPAVNSSDGRPVLTQELRARLIDLLLRIPIAASLEGRNVFLTGVSSLALNRSPNNARVDLDLIIEQLNALGRLESGESPLLLMIDNALPYVKGLEIASDLQELRARLV